MNHLPENVNEMLMSLLAGKLLFSALAGTCLP